ncbi:MAG: ORF6N domain-containing protein [Bacteroidota bacterium]
MELIKFNEVENKIITLRNTKVIIDSDVAQLYGVLTRDINKAVKNNLDKFPEGYLFELTKQEKNELVENFHHLQKLKFSSQNPKGFTEKGLYMLATILKSPQATQTTLAIIEPFAKIKGLSQTIKEVADTKDEKQKHSLLEKSGKIIAELLDDDFTANEAETTIELNFAVLKFKHTIKSKKL